MRGLTWLLDRSSKTVGEHHEIPRRFAVRQRLKDDVVAALWGGRPVPRSVEGDERPSAVGGGKQGSLVQSEVVGGPVGWERGDRGPLLRAQTDRLSAVA